MYYPYTAGVAALSHFYLNPLYFGKRGAKKCAEDGVLQRFQAALAERIL